MVYSSILPSALPRPSGRTLSLECREDFQTQALRLGLADGPAIVRTISPLKPEAAAYLQQLRTEGFGAWAQMLAENPNLTMHRYSPTQPRACSMCFELGGWSEQASANRRLQDQFRIIASQFFPQRAGHDVFTHQLSDVAGEFARLSRRHSIGFNLQVREHPGTIRLPLGKEMPHLEISGQPDLQGVFDLSGGSMTIVGPRDYTDHTIFAAALANRLSNHQRLFLDQVNPPTGTGELVLWHGGYHPHPVIVGTHLIGQGGISLSLRMSPAGSRPAYPGKPGLIDRVRDFFAQP